MTKFFMHGRMMSGSKRHTPGHVEVYNANIFTREGGKVWFGDLDLTADADRLKEFAAEQGHELYVLHEMDGRFEYERKPRWDRAVARITPDGQMTINEKAGRD